MLLAVCDARYCFHLFDVGQYGSNNDAGVLARSCIGKGFENDTLNLPAPETLNHCTYDPLPYFMVGDEIFPLKTWMMRPYPGKLNEEERIFNYRLSRARRVIENAFGILAARWRIFNKPIKASVENVERYVLACISLHNYLCQTENASYCARGYVDSEDGNGAIKPGQWRGMVNTNEGAFNEIPRVRGSRPKEDAVEMRKSLMKYVNEEDAVDWQLDHARRT